MRHHLRLWSALVMLTFVVGHLVNHALALLSIELANDAAWLLILPWDSPAGLALLAGAFLVHLGNALWSIYARRSLRMSRWEGWQIALGLAIPAILLGHIMDGMVAKLRYGVFTDYRYIVTMYWVDAPWRGALQGAALLVVWVHACIGIHFWLRIRDWYPRWRPLLTGVALVLPTLALSGFVAAGGAMLRQSRDPTFLDFVYAESGANSTLLAHLDRVTLLALAVYTAIVGMPFVGRWLRPRLRRARNQPRLGLPHGRTVPIPAGATILETLRAAEIPHASVCGGRGRCTTCRVRILRAAGPLAEPAMLEARALARLSATEDVRLACQLRPTCDLMIVPLLAPDIDADAGRLHEALEGSERVVTVMFVDLRESTGLSERRLPYDVLFLLNHFFGEMTKALEATNGLYSQFTGDGLMALYGLNSADPAQGARDALKGAGEMLRRLDILNHHLAQELPEPLRIGIGIHHGEAIVGSMGPPRTRVVSAIGDTVNIAARLESLTKQFDCPLIVSRDAVAAARISSDRPLHETNIRGRSASVAFYALTGIPAL